MYRKAAAFTAVSAILGLAALPALAQSTPRLDQRQENQERRIEQGVQSGQLNAREAARLERKQERIDRSEARAKADGVVTRQERARLHHQENVQSRHIARQKHDRQTGAK